MTPHLRPPSLLKREHRISREPTETEIALYQAHFGWYESYLPSQLEDINRIEAFKAGAAFGSVRSA